MIKRVITIGADEPIRAIWFLMEEHNIRHIPVVDNQSLIGIVSDQDFYKALPSITEIRDHAKLAKTLDVVKVKDVMARSVKAVKPEMDIREAARLFVENKLGCFPVVSEGKLVGILTTTDLMRYIAERDPGKTPF